MLALALGFSVAPVFCTSEKKKIFLRFSFHSETGFFLLPQSFFIKTYADVSRVLLLNIQRDSELNAKGQM